MSTMHGNFNPMLNLKGNDNVDARGWLIWDDDDESAEITVKISQNGVTHTADPITRVNHTHPRDPEDTWKVDVPANGTPFLLGSASGSAKAVVTTKSGAPKTYDYYWASPPLTLT